MCDLGVRCLDWTEEKCERTQNTDVWAVHEYCCMLYRLVLRGWNESMTFEGGINRWRIVRGSPLQAWQSIDSLSWPRAAPWKRLLETHFNCHWWKTIHLTALPITKYWHWQFRKIIKLLTASLDHNLHTYNYGSCPSVILQLCSMFGHWIELIQTKSMALSMELYNKSVLLFSQWQKTKVCMHSLIMINGKQSGLWLQM